MKQFPVITIDGPSGSGKGTVSQLIAQRLGWHFLDSGALYRLTALAAQQHGLDLANEASLAILAGHLDVQFITNAQGAAARILLEGVDVTDTIRTEQCGEAASKISVFPNVRAALLERQRAFRLAPGLVADGRDMGSIVFPDAFLKVFLTASAKERAQRRYKQLKAKGLNVNLATVLEELLVRDQRDKDRSVAPLKPTQDAIVLDTTGLSVKQVVDEILAHYQQGQ
jgi:CMP/dCMP kinase